MRSAMVERLGPLDVSAHGTRVRRRVPLLETLTLYVGGATAKAVFKVWLKDQALAESGLADLNDLIKAKVPGYLEQRRTAGFFDRVAEEVAQKLSPFYDVEFSRLPENERNAAACAVADAVNSARLSPRRIAETNAEPLALEREIRRESPTIAADNLLSADATQLYDITLREVCNYIAEIATTLPPFGTAATLELLRRGDELLGLVRTVLEKLPQSATSLAEVGRSVVRFEDQYRKDVAHRYDRLTLFGLGLTEREQRYNLSVAYITLATTSIDATGSRDGRDPAKPASVLDEQPLRQSKRRRTPRDDEDDADYVRVDTAVAATPRVLVRGEAGSGKTTLLQWLAVTSARREFEGELSKLNESFPFFLPLRRYVDRELPEPGHFLRDTSPALAGVVPHGWIEAQLESGRAVVLVDGVDELPVSRKRDVELWLSSLCEVYPRARYIVTSRPAAVEREWLTDIGFRQTELQPMDAGDTDAFIEHWHRAARAAVVDDAAREELDGLRDRLRRELRRRAALRSLATSPLLCAVLCTLNRARSRLPKDRIELYRFALDLLLEGRDVERDVSDPEGLELTIRQKEPLLSDLAYWLLLADQSDVERERAKEILGRKGRQIPGLAASGEQLYRHLLIRSGLIREPVEARMDFIHRTFQEYLAAEEALDQNHVPVLLTNALRPEWREVIVLAAGLARADQRQELLSGLLDAGSRDEEHRHTLHLLAVACLETAQTLPEDLQDRIERALERLVPPTNMSEARSLASAGDLAVPLIRPYAGGGVRVATSTARALALVGTDAALDALTEFAHERRLTVIRELIKGWSYFDPEEYAARVLEHSPLIHGHLALRGSRMLTAARTLRRLRALTVELIGDDVDLDLLASLPTTFVRIARSRSVVDLDAFRHHEHLAGLSIESCPELTDLSGLAQSRLVDIAIHGRTAIRSIAPLVEAPLEQLSLFGQTQLSDAHLVSRMASLVRARLIASAVEGEIDLCECPGLEDVSLVSNPRIQRVRIPSATRRLSLGQTGIVAIELPREGSRLGHLSATNTPMATLEGLERASQLSSLVLIGCGQLEDIDKLASAHRLRHLDLERCQAVRDLSPVHGLPALEWIDVTGTAVDDLRPLADCPNLAEVRAYGVSAEALAAFRRIREDVAISA